MTRVHSPRDTGREIRSSGRWFLASSRLLAAVVVVAFLGAAAEAHSDTRRSLKRAQRALEDAQDELDDARRECRKGMSTNLKNARRQIKRVRRDPSRRRIKEALTFVSGLVVAARAARCPRGLVDELKDAKGLLRKARRSLRRDDDDDDDDDRRGGGGVRRDLKKAQRAIQDVEDELDNASRKCRQNLRANVRSAGRQARSLRRHATKHKLEGFNGFMAGLYLACKMSNCTKGICRDVHLAHKAVHRAKGRIGGGGRSSGGGHRRFLRKARQGMEDAIDAIGSSNKTCQQAMLGNLRHSKNTIRNLEINTSGKALADHKLFVGGMILAGALAKCSASVMNPLKRGSRMLDRASSAYRQ